MKILMGGSPCTSWSIAKQNRETTSSGEGWELFLNYKIALDKYKPDYFLYENNWSISTAIKKEISKALGVHYIMLNSADVSAQNRERCYWTNIPIPLFWHLPQKNLLVKDILETGKPLRKDKAYCLTASYNGAVIADTLEKSRREMVAEPVRIGEINKGSQGDRIYSTNGKSITLKANGGGGGANTGLYAVDYLTDENVAQLMRPYGSKGKILSDSSDKTPTVMAAAGTGGGNGIYYAEPYEVLESADTLPHCGALNNGLVIVTTQQAIGAVKKIYEVKDGTITVKGKQYPIKLADGYYYIRKLSVLECKRLQTIPDDYIMPCSKSQCYKMIGNGWTVDVIAELLSLIPGITSEPVEVLSMYDGMSCGQIALNKLGANITKYYATEIDKYAIQTTQANFPDTIQLGDAFQVREKEWKL